MSVRGKLLFQPSESTDISLIGDYSDREDNGQARQTLPGTTYSNRGIGGVGLPGPIPTAIIPYCDVRSRYDTGSRISEYHRYRGRLGIASCKERGGRYVESTVGTG